MNSTGIKKGSRLSRIVALALAASIGLAAAPALVPKAYSGDGAAFLGGMVAGHIIGGAIRRDQIRTAAAVQAANSPPRTAAQAAPPAPAAKSPQARIEELDKLAAGGYITPEEYKNRKKEILDSI
jgi:hypothetical protein